MHLYLRHNCRRASAENSILPVLVSLCRSRLRRFFFYHRSDNRFFATHQCKCIIHHFAAFVKFSIKISHITPFTHKKKRAARLNRAHFLCFILIFQPFFPQRSMILPHPSLPQRHEAASMFCFR